MAGHAAISLPARLRGGFVVLGATKARCGHSAKAARRLFSRMRFIALHWVCAAPTPYNDFLFGRLASERWCDLTVHYLSGGLPSHPWQTRRADYRQRLCRGPVDLGLLRHTLDGRAQFLVAGWNQPTAWALMASLRGRGRPYLFFSDTPSQRPRPWYHRHLREAVVGPALDGTKAVLTTGPTGRAAYRQFGLPDRQIIEFPYFVALPPVVPERAAPEGRPLRLAAVGRLHNAHKGWDVLLAALRQARRAGHDLRLTLVGAGLDEAALRRQAAVLDLDEAVEFTGWLEAEAVAAVLRSSDALVHPARYEPYGVAILEAMAWGLPVFGSEAAGAVVDRVVHGRNGWVHPAGDTDRLAEQLAAAAAAPARLVEAGREARRTAEQWPVERGLAILRAVLEAS